MDFGSLLQILLHGNRRDGEESQHVTTEHPRQSYPSKTSDFRVTSASSDETAAQPRPRAFPSNILKTERDLRRASGALRIYQI